MYKSLMQPQARSDNSVFIPSVTFSIIQPAEFDSDRTENLGFFSSSYVFCLCRIIISQICLIQISFLELSSCFLIAVYPHL